MQWGGKAMVNTYFVTMNAVSSSGSHVSASSGCCVSSVVVIKFSSDECVDL